MNKLNRLREKIDEIILSIESIEERKSAYIHLYGVSELALVLALKRGLNTELASIAGILHDVFRYRTGIYKDHDKRGAGEAKQILEELRLLNEEEICIIESAIYHHSDKLNIHDTYDELLKDADILQQYLYNMSLELSEGYKERVHKVLNELGLAGYSFGD